MFCIVQLPGPDDAPKQEREGGWRARTGACGFVASQSVAGTQLAPLTRSLSLSHQGSAESEVKNCCRQLPALQGREDLVSEQLNRSLDLLLEKHAALAVDARSETHLQVLWQDLHGHAYPRDGILDTAVSSTAAEPSDTTDVLPDGCHPSSPEPVDS